MASVNKDFRVKNGLVVEGSTATVNGNAIITSASSVNDLADVTVTSPSSGQVLKWNGTAWVNDTDATGAGGGGNSFTTIDVPNGTDPVADSATDTLTFADGANITITGDSTTDTVTVAVDTDIIDVNSLTFDTTPTSVPTTQGTLAWNADQETVDIQLDANVTLPVGQKHVIRVKNNSGSVAIAKGRVVVFAGATGDTVTVSPAISTSAYEPYTLVGVTSEEIPADSFGFVTQYGFLNQVNTSGWTLGDLLYVDPASPGVLTNSPPSAPNWKFPIAAVTRVHASTGRILVRAIPGGHLHDIVDVTITSPADNEVLAYNSGDGTWINQTASEAELSVVGHTHSLADVTDVTSSAAELNILDGATLSTTELNYVGGVTSAIQTQINGKADTSHTHAASDVTSGTFDIARIPTGTTGTTVALGSTIGLTPVIPTSVGAFGTESSASVDSTGLVTFSTVTSVGIYGCFSSSYNNYMILISFGTAAAANTAFLRFVTGTSVNSTSNYNCRFGTTNSGAIFAGASSTGQTSVTRIMRYETTGGNLWLNVFSPNQSDRTRIHGIGTDTLGSMETYGGGFNATTVFNGFRLYAASGTIEGTVRVYGYAI